MNYEEKYLRLLDQVLEEGEIRTNRNGNTKGIFGAQLKIDSLRYGLFPILTTRTMSLLPIMGELSAFLAGCRMLSSFKSRGCNYWDMNAAQWSKNKGLPQEQHEVGNIYGAQWRDWNSEGIDQLQQLVQGIKTDPFSRRHIMTCWNPGQLQDMCLPPCHIIVQAYVCNNNYLDLRIDMRSVDLALGLPTDVVLYAGFLVALAYETYRAPGSLIFQFGDAHIYTDHVKSVVRQLERTPEALPGYVYDDTSTLGNFSNSSIVLNGYNPQGPIKYALL